MRRSRSSCDNQVISCAVVASALYSASVEDRDTVSCLLADHDTRLGPRNVQKPVVDLLVSWQPAQSLSQKARRDIVRSFLMCSPSSEVPFRYRIMRFSNPKSDTVGECILWQMKLAANCMSGRVIVRYCNLLAKLRKYVGSGKELGSRFSTRCGRGVGIGLQSNIWAWRRMSSVYAFWCRKMPFWWVTISIPRKYSGTPISFIENLTDRESISCWSSLSSLSVSSISSTYKSKTIDLSHLW